MSRKSSILKLKALKEHALGELEKSAKLYRESAKYEEFPEEKEGLLQEAKKIENEMLRTP